MPGNMWENPSDLKALLVLGAAPAPAVVDEEPVAELGILFIFASHSRQHNKSAIEITDLLVRFILFW